MKKIVFFIMLAIITVSCKKNDDEIASLEHHAASNIIIVSQRTAPISFDPLEANDVSSNRIIYNIYSRLIDINKENQIVPKLANSFDFIDDFQVKFNLRKNIFFHNGNQLTAEDVLYSIERVKNSEDENKNNLFRDIEKIEIIDEYSFTVTSSVPIRGILVNFSDISASIVSKEVALVHDDLYPNPIGSGPFYIDDYSDLKQIFLKPHQKFYDPPSSLEGLFIKSIESQNERLLFLESGEQHITFDIGGDGKKAINELSQINLDSSYTLSTCYLGINLDNSVLDNLQIRKALVSGIDINTILSELFMTDESRANSILSPSYPEYSKYTRIYDFFQNGALDLINNNVGLDKRLSFDFVFLRSNSLHRRIAQRILENLNQVNIHINLVACGEEEFRNRIENKEYDLVINDTSSNEKNPYNLLQNLLFEKYQNNPKEFHFLLEEIQKENDISKNNVLYEEIQNLINDNIYIYPIYFNSIDVGYLDSIKNVNLLPDNVIDFYELSF